MPNAIRWTCSHCQAEVYFDPTAAPVRAVLALNAARCSACGELGGVFTLNVEPPTDAALMNDVPTSGEPRPWVT